MEIGENDKAPLECKDCESISYEWTFRITKAKYPEQEGAPIVRIMGQSSSVGRAIYNELEQGVRNPEGILNWLVKKLVNQRDDLEASGGLN